MRGGGQRTAWRNAERSRAVPAPSTTTTRLHYCTTTALPAACYHPRRDMDVSARCTGSLRVAEQNISAVRIGGRLRSAGRRFGASLRQTRAAAWDGVCGRWWRDIARGHRRVGHVALALSGGSALRCIRGIWHNEHISACIKLLAYRAQAHGERKTAGICAAALREKKKNSLRRRNVARRSRRRRICWRRTRCGGQAAQAAPIGQEKISEKAVEINCRNRVSRAAHLHCIAGETREMQMSGGVRCNLPYALGYDKRRRRIGEIDACC